ncbi:cupin domain-containing protein [Mycobacterium rufum]|uniref:Cupin domain-containing protein n=2 Tax=Mycolicibacterium rufum TaxID=318424 RepID=A0A9X3BQZ5_9MYCO|nr:cupin [Mycolicibacterium rufum]MCV7073047.1 cupin domain-containing protein [Mycolicibacterium rufum]
MGRMRRWCMTVPAVAAVLFTPGGAGATPGAGVDAVTLSDSTADGSHYVAKLLTIAPGGGTGWHFHPGDVFGVVRSGTLTHYAGDCSVDGVYPAGSTITERSGPGYVHAGRNEGPDPLVMWVLYVNPADPPDVALVVDAPDPGCPLPGSG